MKSRHSDMLELFNKVAEEKKLFDEPFIALAKEEDSSDKSSEIDPIELLYGKKKELKSNDELLENAHPETSVKSPAYDLMNGVVENLHQRQRVMTDIAFKTPRVLQTNYRYVKAKQDLLEETTKLGFLLENKKSNLASHADNCTYELTKEANPLLGVGAWAIAKWVVGILGVGALGAAVVNNVPNSLGILNDLKVAIKEISDVIEKYPKYSSALSSYNKLLNSAHSLISELEDLDIELSSQRASLASLPKEQRINAIISLYSQMSSSKKDEKILNLIKECNNVLSSVVEATPQIINIIQKVSSLDEKSSTLMSIFKSVKEFIVPDDIKEAINQLNVLLDSANMYMSLLNDKEQNLLSLKNEISKYHSDNVKQEFLETVHF